MDYTPNFSYELVKQGAGNPVSFQLADVTDALRSQLNNYTLASGNIKAWSLEVEEWFLSDANLNDFTTYYLCMQIPASHVFAGHIQNVGTLFTDQIVLAGSGVSKSVETGIPYIDSKFGFNSYVFNKAAGAAGETSQSDQIVLTVKDAQGNSVPNSAKFKIKIRYREYIRFN